MTDGFRLDARRWRLLHHADSYAGPETGLLAEPLARQFRTARTLLERLAGGRGALLADDAGLGKTTVAALVAWAVACQGHSVRIHVPNKTLRDRWARELARCAAPFARHGADPAKVHQLRLVGRLRAGHIQLATHHDARALQARGAGASAGLLIVDEAHRAKAEASGLRQAVEALAQRAQRVLLLTATPMSLQPAELQRLLALAGAPPCARIQQYADELARLHQDRAIEPDLPAQVRRLARAAEDAVQALAPWVIRHSIEHLPAAERRRYGRLDAQPWAIPVRPATAQELTLLLRLDRLMHLVPERSGERRYDPRFHIGWEPVADAVDRAAQRAAERADALALRHAAHTRQALDALRTQPHPKMAAVAAAVAAVTGEQQEKVLVFCHHRATAAELLRTLEATLPALPLPQPPRVPAAAWRAAWEAILHRPHDQHLVVPLIDWLCSPGLCAQVQGWLKAPSAQPARLVSQLERQRPRGAPRAAGSIAAAARALADVLLDARSPSTRAMLRAMGQAGAGFARGRTHFPGGLDAGLRVLGAWDAEGGGDPPRSLYAGRADIVLALFNSPFGPDVLVATDRLSEGVDLHRWCRHLIHYELDPSPVRTLQRNGRVRRIGSWAAVSGRTVRYAYPAFAGTRDARAVAVMAQRLDAFDLLLGGVPKLDVQNEDDAPPGATHSAEHVVHGAREQLRRANARLRA